MTLERHGYFFTKLIGTELLCNESAPIVRYRLNENTHIYALSHSKCDRFLYFLETGEFVVHGGGADTVGETNYLNLQRSIWLHGKFYENVTCIAWPVWHTDWVNVCASP